MKQTQINKRQSHQRVWQDNEKKVKEQKGQPIIKMSCQLEREETIRWRWRKIKTKSFVAAANGLAAGQQERSTRNQQQNQMSDAARPEVIDQLANVSQAANCEPPTSRLSSAMLARPLVDQHDSFGLRPKRLRQESTEQVRGEDSDSERKSPAESGRRGRPSAASRAPPAVQLINCSTTPKTTRVLAAVCLLLSLLVLLNWPQLATAAPPPAPLVPYELGLGAAPFGNSSALLRPELSFQNGTNTTTTIAHSSNQSATNDDEHDLLFQLLKSTGSVLAANKLLEKLLSQEQMLERERELAAMGGPALAGRQLPSHLESLSVQQADYNQVRASLSGAGGAESASSSSSASASPGQLFGMPDRLAADSNEAPIRLYVPSGLPEGAELTLTRSVESAPAPEVPASNNTSASSAPGGLLDEIIAASASRPTGPASQANRNVHYDDELAPGAATHEMLPISVERARDLLQSSKMLESILQPPAPTKLTNVSETGAVASSSGELRAAASGAGGPANQPDYEGLNNNESISSLLIRAGEPPRRLIANYSHLINHELPRSGLSKRTRPVPLPASNSTQWHLVIGEARQDAHTHPMSYESSTTSTTVAPTTANGTKKSSFEGAEVERLRSNGNSIRERDEEAIDSLASRHELTRVKPASRLSESATAGHAANGQLLATSELSNVNNLRDDTEKIRLNKKNETGLHRVVFINSMPQWAPARTRTTPSKAAGSTEEANAKVGDNSSESAPEVSPPASDVHSVSLADFQVPVSQLYSIEPHEAATSATASIRSTPTPTPTTTTTTTTTTTKKPRRLPRVTSAVGQKSPSMSGSGGGKQTSKRPSGSKNSKQTGSRSKRKQTTRKMVLLSTTRLPSMSAGSSESLNETSVESHFVPEEVVATTPKSNGTQEEAKVRRAAKSLNLVRLFLGTTSVDPAQLLGHGASSGSLPSLMTSEYTPSEEPARQPQIFVSTTERLTSSSPEPKGLRVLPSDVLAPTPDSLALGGEPSLETTRESGTTRHQPKGPASKWRAVELPLREHSNQQATSTAGGKRRAQKQRQTPSRQTTPMANPVSHQISRANHEAGLLLRQLKSLSNTRLVMRPSNKNKTRTAAGGGAAKQQLTPSSTESYVLGSTSSTTTRRLERERDNQTRRASDSIRRSTLTTSTSSPLFDLGGSTPSDYSQTQSVFPSASGAFDDAAGSSATTNSDLTSDRPALRQFAPKQTNSSASGGAAPAPSSTKRPLELDLETTMAGTPRPTGTRSQPISQQRLIDQSSSSAGPLNPASFYGKRLPGDRPSGLPLLPESKLQQQLFTSTSTAESTRAEIEPSAGSNSWPSDSPPVANQSSSELTRGGEDSLSPAPGAHEQQLNSWTLTSSLPPTQQTVSSSSEASGRIGSEPGSGATSPALPPPPPPATSSKETLGPLVYATPPSRATLSSSPPADVGVSPPPETTPASSSSSSSSASSFGLLEDPLPSILFHNRLSSLFKYKLANRTAPSSTADAFDFLSAEKAAAAGLAYPPVKYHEVPASAQPAGRLIAQIAFKSNETTSMSGASSLRDSPPSINLGFYGSFYDRPGGQQAQELLIRNQNASAIDGNSMSPSAQDDDKEAPLERDRPAATSVHANARLLRREKDEATRRWPMSIPSPFARLQLNATMPSIDLSGRSSSIESARQPQQGFAQVENRPTTTFDVQTSTPTNDKKRQFPWLPTTTTTSGLDFKTTTLSTNGDNGIQFGSSSTSSLPASTSTSIAPVTSEEPAPSSNEEQADLNVYVKPIARDEQPSSNKWRLMTGTSSLAPHQLLSSSRRPSLKRVEKRKRRREPPILPPTPITASSPQPSTFASSLTTAAGQSTILAETWTPSPSTGFNLESTRADSTSEPPGDESSTSEVRHEQPITTSTLSLEQQLNDSPIEDNSLGNLFARLPQAYANFRANMSRPQLVTELLQMQHKTTPSLFIEMPATTTSGPDYLASPSSEVPINYIMPPALNQTDASQKEQQQANMEEALLVDGSQDWRSSSLGPLVSDFRTKSILRTMINLGVPNNAANLPVNSSNLFEAARRQQSELPRVIKVTSLRRQQSTTSSPATTVSSTTSTSSPSTTTATPVHSSSPQAQPSSSLRPPRRNTARNPDRLQRQPFLPPRLTFPGTSPTTSSPIVIEASAASTSAPSTTTAEPTTTTTTTTSSTTTSPTTNPTTTTTSTTTTSTRTTPAPTGEPATTVKMESVTSGPISHTPVQYETTTSPPTTSTSNVPVQTTTTTSRPSKQATITTTTTSAPSTSSGPTSRPVLQTKRAQSIFELADEQEMQEHQQRQFNLLNNNGPGQVRNQRHQPPNVSLTDLIPKLTMTRDQLPGDNNSNLLPTLTATAGKAQHLSAFQRAAVITIVVFCSLVVICLLIAALTIKCGSILSRSAARRNASSPAWAGPTRRRAQARKGRLIKNGALAAGVRSRSAGRLVQKEPARFANAKLAAPKRRSRSNGPPLLAKEHFRNQLLDNSSSADSSIESLCLSTSNEGMNFVPQTASGANLLLQAAAAREKSQKQKKSSRSGHQRAMDERQQESQRARQQGERSIGQRITGTLTSRLLRLHLPRLMPQLTFDHHQQQQHAQHQASMNVQYGLQGATAKRPQLHLDPGLMLGAQTSSGHTKHDNQYANFHLVAKHQTKHQLQTPSGLKQMFSANPTAGKCSGHLGQQQQQQQQQRAHGEHTACNCANCLYAWSSSSSSKENLPGLTNGPYQARAKQLPFGAGSSVLRHAGGSGCHLLDTKAPIPPVRTHSRGQRQESVDQVSVQHSQMDNEHHLLIDGDVSAAANTNLAYRRAEGHMNALGSRFMALGNSSNSSRPPLGEACQQQRQHHHKLSTYEQAGGQNHLPDTTMTMAREEGEQTTSDEVTESENQYDLQQNSDAGRKTLGSNCRCNLLMYPL